MNKAGEKLLSSKSEEEYNKSLAIINDWRTNHLVPLEELKNNITSLLKKNNILPFLVSQRLKRMTSIQYKLDLNPNMRLGGVQDIGGLRVVLDSIFLLQKVLLLVEKNIGNFEYQRTSNYLLKPKDSGYRSVHVIYKYKSSDEKYDGLRIELQIRTQLQHSWATALETVDIHTKSALKSGQGDDEWLDFFKIVSSLFAHKEKQPTLVEHSSIKLEELMRMYYRKNNSKKHVSLLKAYKVSNEHFSEVDNWADYYLLNIDLEKRQVFVCPFSKNDFQEATNQYYKLENKIEENKNAVVLVATSSYKTLKEAYPSYFSDITEFITSLDKVEENCKKLGLT